MLPFLVECMFDHMHALFTVWEREAARKKSRFQDRVRLAHIKKAAPEGAALRLMSSNTTTAPPIKAGRYFRFCSRSDLRPLWDVHPKKTARMTANTIVKTEAPMISLPWCNKSRLPLKAVQI